MSCHTEELVERRNAIERLRKQDRMTIQTEREIVTRPRPPIAASTTSRMNRKQAIIVFEVKDYYIPYDTGCGSNLAGTHIKTTSFQR